MNDLPLLVQIGMMFLATIAGGCAGYFSSFFLSVKQERAAIRKHWLDNMTDDVSEYLALLESLSHEIRSEGKAKELIFKEVLGKIQRLHSTQYRIALRLDFRIPKHVEYFQPILDLQEVMKQVDSPDDFDTLHEQFRLKIAILIESIQQLFAIEREKIEKFK